MKEIQNIISSIGEGYPTQTGRLKQVTGTDNEAPKKVALIGDSTIDNGYWVRNSKRYEDLKHNVHHQTAVALAKNTDSDSSYEVANFAVDGATTADLMRYCPLDKVLPTDSDHTRQRVFQLGAVSKWKPDVVVLSVGGNNYREALRGTLESELSYTKLLFRTTPDTAKPVIKGEFDKVKQGLIDDYKKIIDDLIENNPDASRLVLLSQYFPSLTQFTGYFIFTGFSHLARSEGSDKANFTVVEDTINDLYREILSYAATKNKEVVFVDVTSSLNPLGGKHTLQIEPNEQGSEVMGRLIASAVDYEFDAQNPNYIPRLRMSADEKSIECTPMTQDDFESFEVKKLDEYISENRYKHFGLFFSPKSSLRLRYESAYHMIMGKQFDAQYTGLFAFGLLDASLVTIFANYLWRAVLNDNLHGSVRIAAGVIAAPILIVELIVGLALLALLALPIYGFHKAVEENDVGMSLIN